MNELKEFGKSVIFGGTVLAVGTYICAKAYKKGFIDGGDVGFHLTVDWFDKTFKDLGLREMYEKYLKEHPEILD